jgi:hypothetical protein
VAAATVTQAARAATQAARRPWQSVAVSACNLLIGTCGVDCIVVDCRVDDLLPILRHSQEDQSLMSPHSATARAAQTELLLLQTARRPRQDQASFIAALAHRRVRLKQLASAGCGHSGDRAQNTAFAGCPLASISRNRSKTTGLQGLTRSRRSVTCGLPSNLAPSAARPSEGDRAAVDRSLRSQGVGSVVRHGGSITAHAVILRTHFIRSQSNLRLHLFWPVLPLFISQRVRCWRVHHRCSEFPC